MEKYTQSQRLEFARTHKEAWPGNVIEHPSEISEKSSIGGDGFGYARAGDGTLIKINHAGNVIIERDVVIRDYVTIDRAVKGSTIIGEGTKIDHHTHCAHNVKIGKYNTLANGCIIEGSCEIGDCNTFGAGVIVQRKVKIGSNCILGSGAVITKDVEDYSVMIGNPARLLRYTNVI